jgi:hypothetical protein
MRHAIAVLAGAVLLTACGSGAGAHPAKPADAGNIRVCEHYRTQRAKLLNNATPTLSTAVQVAVWVTADAAQATPGTPLARHLNQMLAAMRSRGGSTYAASKQVHADCQALGVPITH